MFEANAVWVERQTYILSFAVRWAHEKRTKVYTLPDYPLYKIDPHNDRSLCDDLFKVLDEADIIIAHNGDNFDLKKIHSRLAAHNLKPPAPYRTIDTLKISRRVFKWDSNKLDNLGRYLGVGRKLPHTGADLWRGCVNGDPKSWALMARYNRQDVDLLMAVFDRIKMWAPNLPDLRVYTGAKVGCPTCLSTNVQRRGFNVARTRKTERFQCQDCGAWHTGATIKAEAA